MNLKRYIQTSLGIQILILLIQFLNVQFQLNLLDIIIPVFLLNTVVLFVLSIISLIKKENIMESIISLVISSICILFFYLLIQALKTFT